MRLAFKAVISSAILYCGFAAPAAADEPAKPSLWSFGVTAGTLGAGAEAEASVLVYDNFVFRVNGSYVKLNSSWVISASSVASDYNFGVTGIFAGAILDYHPLSSGWRGSIGVRYADIELQNIATNGANFGGASYSISQIGTVTTTIRNSNPAAPYLVPYQPNLVTLRTDCVRRVRERCRTQ